MGAGWLLLIPVSLKDEKKGSITGICDPKVQLENWKFDVV
jgi:hypothetical protein